MTAEAEGDNETAMLLNHGAIIDAIPAPVVCVLPNGSVECVNQRWLQYTGLSSGKLADWGWQTVLHSDDLRNFLHGWDTVREAGEAFQSEARVRRSDGEYRWFWIIEIPLRDRTNRIVRWYGAGFDIDDRRRSEDRLRLIVDTTPALIHTGLPDGYLDFFNQTWLRYVGLQSEETEGWKWTNAIHPEDVPAIVEKWCASLASGEPFLHEARVRRADGVYRSMLHHKIAARDVHGNIVKWYGSSIDIEDRKRTEDELQRSEAYLAEAQRLSHTGSFGWRVSTSEVFWSEETFRIFGYDKATIPTVASILQRVHPEDAAFVKWTIERASQDGTSFDFEHRLLMPDGSVKYVHVVSHAHRTEARTVEFVGAVMDVTAARQAELQLRRSEQALRLTLESLPGLVWTMLPDGTVEFCNQRILSYCGKTLDELQDLTCVLYPDEAHEKVRQLRCSLNGGVQNEMEFRFRRYDGVYRWHQCRLQPLRMATGQITHWYGLIWDIEERKTAEEKLRRNEAYLLEGQRLTHTGSWSYDVSSGTVMVSPESHRIYGILPDEDASNLELYFHRIHPDERNRVRQRFDTYVIQKIDYQESYPIVLPDGSLKHLRVTGHPVFNESGQLVEFVGTTMDVSEQFQARAKLDEAFNEIKELKDRLYDENLALREQIDQVLMFEEIVGTSSPLRAIISRVTKVAPTDSTVLITGETGTGKELFARAIHKRSHRCSRAFISVNCAAIPRELIASEFFGHEKGAFTGATQRRLGRFELAGGGTIFLDEIGELPLETQTALLRVLQEHEFERVGGSGSIRADVRVIAATNRDLEAATGEGRFRRDLFYRLNVFPIDVPPLRERREDIRLLVEYFTDRYARKIGKRIRGVNKKTLRLLESYPWPGNIRELQNVIERSVIVCETEILSVDESWLLRQPLASEAKSPKELYQRLAEQEKEMIEAALRESDGTVSGPTGAAAKLGIHRSTLESKIASLRINKHRFKGASKGSEPRS